MTSLIISLEVFWEFMISGHQSLAYIDSWEQEGDEITAASLSGRFFVNSKSPDGDLG